MKIQPYLNNEKKHNKNQINNVAQSIKEFGMTQPIVVDKEGVIIIGHCRFEALKKLGYTDDNIPDEYIKCIDISKENADRLRLIDNKTNESDWDNDLLNGIIPTLDFTDYKFDWKIKTNDDDEDEEGEIKFSECLGEENNFIVLQFKTDIDWLQALSYFDIETVKCRPTKNNGGNGLKRIGTGRVLDGAKAMQKIMGAEK